MYNLNYDENTISIFNSFKNRFIETLKDYKKNTEEINLSEEITNVFTNVDHDFFNYYLKTQIAELTNKEVKPLENKNENNLDHENEILLFLTLEVSKKFFNGTNLNELGEAINYFSSEEYFPPSQKVRELLTYIKDLQKLIPDIKFLSGKSAYEGVINDYKIGYLNRLELQNVDQIRDLINYYQIPTVGNKSLSWRNISDLSNQSQDFKDIFSKLIVFSQINFDQSPMFSTRDIFFLDKYFDKTDDIYKDPLIISNLNRVGGINFNAIKDPNLKKSLIEKIELALLEKYTNFIPHLEKFLDTMRCENLKNSANHPFYKLFLEYYFGSFYNEIDNFLIKNTPNIDFSSINEIKTEIKKAYDELLSTERENILSKNSQEDFIEYLTKKINESPELSTRFTDIFNKFPFTRMIKSPDDVKTNLEFWKKQFAPAHQFCYLLDSLKKVCNKTLDYGTKKRLQEKFDFMLDSMNAYDFIEEDYNDNLKPISRYTLLFHNQTYPAFVSALIDQLYDSLKKINFSEDNPYALTNLLSIFKLLPSLKSSNLLVASSEKDSMFEGFLNKSFFTPEHFKIYEKNLTPEVYHKCTRFFEKLNEIMDSPKFNNWVQSSFQKHVNQEVNKIAEQSLPQLPEIQMNAFFEEVAFKVENKLLTGENKVSIDDIATQFLEKFNNVDEKILISTLLSIYDKNINEYNSNFDSFSKSFNEFHQQITKLFNHNRYVNDVLVGKFSSPEGMIIDILQKLFENNETIEGSLSFDDNETADSNLETYAYRLLRYIEPSDYHFIDRITDYKNRTLSDIKEKIQKNIKNEFSKVRLNINSLQHEKILNKTKTNQKNINVSKTANLLWNYYHSDEWIKNYFENISIDPIEGTYTSANKNIPNLFLSDNSSEFSITQEKFNQFLEMCFNNFVTQENKVKAIFTSEVCKKILLKIKPNLKEPNLKIPTEEMLTVSLLKNDYSENETSELLNKESIPKYFNYVANTENNRCKTPYKNILPLIVDANMSKTKGLEGLYFKYLSHRKEIKDFYDEHLGEFFDHLSNTDNGYEIINFFKEIIKSFDGEMGKKIITDLEFAYQGLDISLENYSDEALEKWEHSKLQLMSFLNFLKDNSEEILDLFNIKNLIIHDQRVKNHLILSKLILFLDSKLPKEILIQLNENITSLIEASKYIQEFEDLLSKHLDEDLSPLNFKDQLNFLINHIDAKYDSDCTYIDFKKGITTLEYWDFALKILKDIIQNSSQITADAITKFASAKNIEGDYTVKTYNDEVISSFNRLIVNKYDTPVNKYQTSHSLAQFNNLRVYASKMAEIVRTEQAASVIIDLVKDKNILNAYRSWIFENCFDSDDLDNKTIAIILKYFQDFARNDCYTKEQIEKFQSKMVLKTFPDHVKIKLELLKGLFNLFTTEIPSILTNPKDIAFNITTNDKKYILVQGCENAGDLYLRGHIGFLPNWEISIKNNNPNDIEEEVKALRSTYLLHPKVAKIQLEDGHRGAYKLHNVVQPVHVGEEAVTTALENIVRSNLVFYSKQVLTKQMGPRAAYADILSSLLLNLINMDTDKVHADALQNYSSVIKASNKPNRVKNKEIMDRILYARSEYIQRITQTLEKIAPTNRIFLKCKSMINNSIASQTPPQAVHHQANSSNGGGIAPQVNSLQQPGYNQQNPSPQGSPQIHSPHIQSAGQPQQPSRQQNHNTNSPRARSGASQTQNRRTNSGSNQQQTSGNRSNQSQKKGRGK